MRFGIGTGKVSGVKTREKNRKKKQEVKREEEREGGGNNNDDNNNNINNKQCWMKERRVRRNEMKKDLKK